MLEMVDYYGGTILILALASFEIIAFNWIYGTNFIGKYCYSFNRYSKIQRTKYLYVQTFHISVAQC